MGYAVAHWGQNLIMIDLFCESHVNYLSIAKLLHIYSPVFSPLPFLWPQHGLHVLEC